MKYFSTLFILGLSLLAFSQEQIKVADLQIKEKGVKKIHYGFQKGDQIIFNLKEIKNKKIHSVVIRQFPDKEIFRKLDVKQIRNQRISIDEKCVVEFEFKSKKKRKYNIQIQRIPKSEKYKDFNTGVDWVDIPTTKHIVQKTDTSVLEIKNTLERVHSLSHLKKKGNRTIVPFQIPESSFYPNSFHPQSSKEIISWAFSIATEGEGTKWYQKAETKAISKTGIGLAIEAGIITSGYGALALLALEGISTFSDPPKGENIKWTLETDQHVLIDQGNSILSSSRYTSDYINGDFMLTLKNDNLINGINVKVRVLAIQLQKTYQSIPLNEQEKGEWKKKYKGLSKIPVNSGQIFP